jgi:hypothetical protein
MPAKTAFFCRMAPFCADLPDCECLADARNDTGKFKCPVNYRVQEKIFRPLFGFYDDLAQACAK